MARPQTYIRGLHRAGAYMVTGDGIYFTPYSTTVPLIDSNSTGLNVVALIINGTSLAITKDSTGVLLGTRYISTNTTGNLAT